MDLRKLQRSMEGNIILRPILNYILLPVFRYKAYLGKKKLFFYMAYQKNWMLDPASTKRQKYWKKCGAHINGQINIGYDVYFDASNAELITIDEGAWITSKCLILCHKRDLSNYCVGDDINKLSYDKAPVHICKGVHIGMGTIVMPGVTIGEGAIIGAGAVVSRDIPAWTIAVGCPAKVVKEIKERQNESSNI